MSKARLDLIKIDAHHCFCCGCLFDEKHKKTKHHVIQQCYKPKRNVVIPLCDNCHTKIMITHIQSLPQFKNIKGFIDNLESFVKHNKKLINKYMEESDDNSEDT